MREARRELDRAERAFHRAIRSARHNATDPASIKEISEAARVAKRTVSVIAGEQSGWGNHAPAPEE